MHGTMSWFGFVVLVALTGHSAVASAQHAARRGDRAQSVRCGSTGHHRHLCRVRGWEDARLVRQLSGARCVRGRTWGLKRGVLWVSGGCRGIFSQVFPHRSSRDRYQRDNDRRGFRQRRPIVMTCGSSSDRYRLCRVDIGRRGSVRLEHQVSRSACVFNRSWGWNRQGVWVNHGCRGRFAVTRDRNR